MSVSLLRSTRRPRLVTSTALALALGLGVAGPVSADQATPDRSQERAAARASYSPKAGPIFAPPAATGQNNLYRALRTNIDSAPSGSVIRGVTWSFTSKGIADALSNADERDVTVRVVVSLSECDNSVVEKLSDDLTGDSHLTCRKGRSRNSAMHSKVWSFSTAGTGKQVVMVTGANATDEAYYNQWTDAYQSVGWTQLYSAWIKFYDGEVFGQGPRTNLFRHWSFPGASEAFATPINRGQTDPVYQRLNALPGKGMVLRLASPAWQQARGGDIARMLVQKKRQGAKIRVAVTSDSRNLVNSILKPAGVPYTYVDRNRNGSRQYLHSKAIAVSFVKGGQRRYMTWTGSSNLNDEALRSDEFTVGLSSKATYQKYAAWISGLRP